MAIVEFDHRVKYRGVFYAPHTPVEITDEDLDTLTSSGAKVLSQNAQDLKSTQDVKPAQKLAAKKPYKIPAPAKKG